MLKYWSAINDDELRLVNKTVDFLQNEFCPSGADRMWSPEYFRWKLGPANPAGKGYVSIAMVDDDVVGTISLTKKRLLINGNECIGGEIGDSYSSAILRRRGRPKDPSRIDPNPASYINKSIFGRLASDVRARAEADGISIIYGTPNKNSYPGYINRLGYFDLKDYCNKSFSRPTSKLVARKHPALNFLGVLLRRMESSSIALQKFVYSQSQSGSLVFEACAPSTDELDNLWIRLKPIQGFSLIRDAPYWYHRYLEHPIAQYTFHSIRKRGGLVGIIVTRLHSVGDGRRVVSFVEWMNEEYIQFGYVLSMIMDFYKNSGAEVFSLWVEGSSQEAKVLAKNLFFFRGRVPIILADTLHARSLQTMVNSFKFYLGSSDAV